MNDTLHSLHDKTARPIAAQALAAFFALVLAVIGLFAAAPAQAQTRIQAQEQAQAQAQAQTQTQSATTAADVGGPIRLRQQGTPPAL